MKARKTIEVAKVRQTVNTILAQPDLNADQREAASQVLETVLHTTGAYKGFRFTDGEAGEADPTKRWYF